MNLANPAPRVEPAVAARIERVEPAIVERAPEAPRATALPASRTEPATLYQKVKVQQPDENTNALSVKGLAENGGIDLQGSVALIRGAAEKNILQRCLPCIYGERDFVSYNEVKKYIAIQNTTCFVYNENSDPRPLYAIALDELYPEKEDPDRLDNRSYTVSPAPNTNKSPKYYVTYLLRSKGSSTSDKQFYQFTFSTQDDPSLPERFFSLAEQASQTKVAPAVATILRPLANDK